MDRPDARLSPEHAAAEIERMHRRVRSGSRWQAWMWLVIAATAIVFTIGTGSGNWIVTDVTGPLPVVVAIVVGILATRQHVVGRKAVAIEYPIAYAFLVAVAVATALRLAVLPDRITVWLVLLALGAALPCLVGAWRVLRES